MSDKKITIKKKKNKGSEKKSKKGGKYFFGIGRRKSAVARVQIFQEKTETALADSVTINERKLKDFFPLAELQDIVLAPFALMESKKPLKVLVKVSGGGIRGQAEAVRLGIARTLVECNESLRKALRDAGYLTRDDRVVERKKAGLKKARRAPQWKKR